MHSAVKTLGLVFAASLVFCAARADDQPNIPASAWEQHPEGIATAITLTSSIQKGIRKNVLTIYIKNTSGASTYHDDNEVSCNGEALFVLGWGDEFSNVRYPPGMTPVQIPQNIPGVEIKPGASVSDTFDVSEKDMKLIEGHQVKCHISFFNYANNAITKRYAVETTQHALVLSP